MVFTTKHNEDQQFKIIIINNCSTERAGIDNKRMIYSVKIQTLLVDDMMSMKKGLPRQTIVM